MRARYYNAAIKRFINQDTVTGSIESSQSLNRYAYVEGNPVSYLDSFGLCPEDRIDTLAYLYDFLTARNDEEKMAAIVGMGVNAMGFSVNNTIDILTNITSVFTEQELKIAHIVISYDIHQQQQQCQIL